MLVQHMLALLIWRIERLPRSMIGSIHNVSTSADRTWLVRKTKYASWYHWNCDRTQRKVATTIRLRLLLLLPICSQIEVTGHSNRRLVPYWREFLGVSGSRTWSDTPFANTLVSPAGAQPTELPRLHIAYPSLHPSGVVHWIPELAEQLNIKVVAAACKLIDGCYLALCSVTVSVV